MSASKARGTPSGRPPEPSDEHAVIAQWSRQIMPGLKPIVRHLDGLIRKTLPDVQYAVKWKKAYYGLPGQGWIIELATYDVSANIVFFAGARFDPPPPLGEGSRYVKIRSLEEARAPEIQEWIRQAGKEPGWL